MIELKPELVHALDTPDGLQTALLNAIKLEHATIPVYLYALYSIVPGSNAAAAAIVRSVVLEEMAHMALACNILNAIGGAPVIDEPSFIPSYPRPLPGGVEGGLEVGLTAFSPDVVEKVFMSIEEPEDPIEIPAELAEVDRVTIGQFYRAIATAIETAGPGPFKDGHHQVELHLGDTDVKKVDSVESALAAITLIVEQGEGTSTSPLDLEHEVAHYYRFGEIYHGHMLVPDANPTGFAYKGDPVPFDSAGVQPVASNPKASDYKEGTRARRMCDNFNYTYTCVLKALDATFNGKPDQLEKAIGAMESCRQQALDLTALTLPDGKHAAPTFEFLPVNPLQ